MAFTNYLKFRNDRIERSHGNGLLSTLTHDFDLEAVPLRSENQSAPTHRLFSKSPRGFRIEAGGIWKKQNRGNPYFTLFIRQLSFNATLAPFPGEDDITLFAIIPWDIPNTKILKTSG